MTTLNKKTAFGLFEVITEDIKALRKELEETYFEADDDDLDAAANVLLGLENELLDGIRSIRGAMASLYENE